MTDDVRWAKCPSCTALVYLKRLDKHAKVCPECSHHWRMPVRERLELLFDDGSFEEFGAGLKPNDPLEFHDSKPYARRLADAERRTGDAEACICAKGSIDGARVIIAAVDFGFMGGSIGGTTGEKIALAARRALDERTPLLIICASGGARMQEGALSLMQLVKTSQEVARLHEAGVLCLNLNTDPTYGGATASFATLGDVIIAEPGARIGFAGPNVIAQTIREELPDGFQTAEFLLANGMLDLVVSRDALRPLLGRLLGMHTKPQQLTETPRTLITDPAQIPERAAWDVVQSARDLGRPTTLDYCAAVFDDGLVELHGDRRSGDDQAVVGGLARLAGRTVVVIGSQKGHSPPDLVRHNFGMPNPSGYHKARRLMAYAERFGFPVVTLVDTPGAFPGADAERSGQGTAIAECIMRMSRLRVPTAVVLTGEGGSGGALALGVGNRVLMLENAYYSVISPEGCSSILWGTSAEASRAAEALKITSRELLALGLVDGVVAEPPGGAQSDWETTARNVRSGLVQALTELDGLTPEQLTEDRYTRFARFGAPVESEVPA
ncbi:acetyl-CoA carboxylase, carboxyltransferase subunit beta [Lentzea kentuckyensis]|uniref:acetyl-CoA carboxylase, carboxyltransferase subunit beta n=1 Tax=Lentzea kentuckyensis TaxID=360086 RepID=UPI000A36F2C5|nr:acetyl-CoA carboxylase, carboxyltransferase subunit beta [Lentzea kentuckyensis]